MKLFVTVLEETFEAALDVIRALPEADHDGLELRAEKLPAVDLDALRAATRKPIILTYRGSRVPSVERALEAGIDFVDVEWRDGVEILAPERTVLSHHDYEGMRDVEGISARMHALGCAHTKLAATPLNFADNERLLALPGSVIGMGERGLYARILAPFRGSELTFVAARAIAAPGQLTLERALEIYGGRSSPGAERVFAVVGNPAGHSLSPSIHNRLFREKGVSAAYTIASLESFSEIEEAFLHGEPCGLSVTAPFKEDAFTFALAHGAEIAPNARRARAVNTLVNLGSRGDPSSAFGTFSPSRGRRAYKAFSPPRGEKVPKADEGSRILADNTDVDGFAALLPPAARKAAVIGAGATARAALVALEDARIPATVFNRTASKGDAPLEALCDFDGDLIVNTLPVGVEVELPLWCAGVSPAGQAPSRRLTGGGGETPPGQPAGTPAHQCTLIEAAYGSEKRGGLALLHAQAKRQHELFMEVFVAV